MTPKDLAKRLDQIAGLPTEELRAVGAAADMIRECVMTADPAYPVYEHEEFVRILGGRRWWRDFQVLALIIHDYGVSDINLERQEPSERGVCGRCAGSGWEGQEPCPWCSSPPEVGMFRNVRPADAQRAFNHLRSFLHGWYQDRQAELLRGIEVRERQQKAKCASCAGKVTVGWVACPHCGERIAA